MTVTFFSFLSFSTARITSLRPLGSSMAVGFIQDDAFRFHCDDARNGNPLLLASGQFIRRRFSVLQHPHRAQAVLYPLPDLACGNAQIFRSESDILFHHGPDDLVIRILEYHTRCLTDVPQFRRITGVSPVHPT